MQSTCHTECDVFVSVVTKNNISMPQVTLKMCEVYVYDHISEVLKSEEITVIMKFN